MNVSLWITVWLKKDPVTSELLAVSSFHVCGPKIQHQYKEVPASDSPESVGFEEKALSDLQRGDLGVSI